jgi:predicted chitinase
VYRAARAETGRFSFHGISGGKIRGISTTLCVAPPRRSALAEDIAPCTYYPSGLQPACRPNDWAANGDRRNALRFFNPTLSMPVQEVRLADLSENLKVTTINNDSESDTVKERTNIWEIAKSVSAIASAVVIPVVLLLASNEFSRAIKEREIQGKFVELAVNILREHPSEDTRNIRGWATQVINAYSGVPLSEKTKNDLIENAPILRYEGRLDLGNTRPGDGARFVGRGYLMITGRANYQIYGTKIGVDLVNNPERVEDPSISAKVLVEYFLNRKERFLTALQAKDYVLLGRLVNGGSYGMSDVQNKFALYQKVLAAHPDGTGLNKILEVANPDWVTIHVPAILRALDAASITDTDARAYILATADFESKQGTVMKELDAPSVARRG